MKLRLISEIQYKETSTNMDRSNSTGVRAQSAINDLLHINPTTKPKKTKPKKDKIQNITEKKRCCPSCGKPFHKDEPYPDVENCEVCERFGPPANTKKSDKDK